MNKRLRTAIIFGITALSSGSMAQAQTTPLSSRPPKADVKTHRPNFLLIVAE